MSFKIFTKNEVFIIVDEITTRRYEANIKNVLITREFQDSINYYFHNVNGWARTFALSITEIKKENGDPYTAQEFDDFSTSFSKSSVDATIQDATTPIFDLFFTKPKGAPTTSTSNVAKGDTTIEVADVSNFEITPETYVGIFSNTGKYYWGTLLEINGNTLTLDSPFDFDFQQGSQVLPTSRNLNVDGSVTPQVFSIQVGQSGLSIDVVRIIISMVTQNSIEMDLFGDRPKLEKGLILRKTNGDWNNFWNVKTNYELGVHAFDIVRYEKVKQNDLDAVLCRMSYGGQDKHGSVLRIDPGTELQLVVQDDLSNLEVFIGIGEGSIVTP